MTPEVQTAFLSSIPLIITAIGAIIVPIVTDYRANKKLNHITVLTNSTLTAANKRIEMLEGIVKDLTLRLDAKP